MYFETAKLTHAVW